MAAEIVREDGVLVSFDSIWNRKHWASSVQHLPSATESAAPVQGRQQLCSQRLSATHALLKHAYHKAAALRQFTTGLQHRPAAALNHTDYMCQRLGLVSSHLADVCCLDMSAWDGLGLLASCAVVFVEMQAP